MPVTLECKNCKENFEVAPYREDSANFCSKKCHKKSQRNGVSPYKNCEHCGDEFEVKPHKKDNKRFCSLECYHNWRGSQDFWKEHPQTKERIELECKWCKREFKVVPSKQERKFCSKNCHDKYRSKFLTGKDNPNYKPKVHETRICKYCNEEFETYTFSHVECCSFECRNNWVSKNWVGENNPLYEGGEMYYGENWHRKRKKVLERDNRKCVICKKGKEELGQMPSVHHIKPIRSFDNPEDANKLDNLVTVCEAHHSKIEGWNLKPDIR